MKTDLTFTVKILLPIHTDDEFVIREFASNCDFDPAELDLCEKLEEMGYVNDGFDLVDIKIIYNEAIKDYDVYAIDKLHFTYHPVSYNKSKFHFHKFEILQVQ